MLATLATRVTEAKCIYISETLNIEHLPTKLKGYRPCGKSWCYGNDSTESGLAPLVPCNLFEGDCLTHVFKKYCVIDARKAFQNILAAFLGAR
jgi:hypothetical protein